MAPFDLIQDRARIKICCKVYTYTSFASCLGLYFTEVWFSGGSTTLNEKIQKKKKKKKLLNMRGYILIVVKIE